MTLARILCAPRNVEIFNPAPAAYPSGRTMHYIRDTVGRITSVSTDFGGQNQTVLSSAQYLPFGPLAGFTFGNGIVVERSHDQQYRVDELSSTGVEDLDYGYDPGGNIDAITDNLNGAFSRAFVQDALDRLTSDQGVFGTRTYEYDSVGNRTGRWLDGVPEQSITVVSNSNRLDTVNSVTVSYDAAGNVLADGTGRMFAYNDLNRLSSASVSGQTVATFAYNAFGQRARKIETASNTSTVFAYGPGGQLLAERRLRSDDTRELEREYLWLDSLPIAMAERSYAADGTTVTASQFVYLHADHLDTPRLATDAAQRVVWRWRSDAFGIGAAETDPDGDSIATKVALRFPGQYLDAETGLHYNYFRDYDPQTGRYVQSDPIGLIGGTNTYAYVGAIPISRVDALGLAYGDFPTIPPGFDETWQPRQFSDGRTYWRDPNGTRWLPHPEDWTHWRHWDKQDKDGNDKGRWPPNSKKMWPLQKKPKKDQCEIDPSGDAPPGPDPSDFLMVPWLMPEWHSPMPGRGGVRIPFRIPIPVW